MQRMQPSPDRTDEAAECFALIFSSNRDFFSYYREMFISLGFIPIIATTPEAAFAILRLTVVVFVIVDQDEGIFESRRVLDRARQTHQHAPILVVTHKADADSRREALAHGATGYLGHPALRGEIVHALFAGHGRMTGNAETKR